MLKNWTIRVDSISQNIMSQKINISFFWKFVKSIYWGTEKILNFHKPDFRPEILNARVIHSWSGNARACSKIFDNSLLLVEKMMKIHQWMNVTVRVIFQLRPQSVPKQEVTFKLETNKSTKVAYIFIFILKMKNGKRRNWWIVVIRSTYYNKNWEWDFPLFLIHVLIKTGAQTSISIRITFDETLNEKGYL